MLVGEFRAMPGGLRHLYRRGGDWVSMRADDDSEMGRRPWRDGDSPLDALRRLGYDSRECASFKSRTACPRRRSC